MHFATKEGALRLLEEQRPASSVPFAWHAPAGKRALELFGGGVRSKYAADFILDHVGARSQPLRVNNLAVKVRKGVLSIAAAHVEAQGPRPPLGTSPQAWGQEEDDGLSFGNFYSQVLGRGLMCGPGWSLPH